MDNLFQEGENMSDGVAVYSPTWSQHLLKEKGLTVKVSSPNSVQSI